MARYFKKRFITSFLLDDDRPSHGSAEGAGPRNAEQQSPGRKPREKAACELALKGMRVKLRGISLPRSGKMTLAGPFKARTVRRKHVRRVRSREKIENLTIPL